jgi:hypothetical protein
MSPNDRVEKLLRILAAGTKVELVRGWRRDTLIKGIGSRTIQNALDLKLAEVENEDDPHNLPTVRITGFGKMIHARNQARAGKVFIQDAGKTAGVLRSG